jgi:hypothetical protein
MGDGAGSGMELVGGASGGDGLRSTGGSGGHGYHGLGGSVNGIGARFAAGGGNASGLEAQGVGVSPGALFRGGATNGDGLRLEALGTGNALEAVVVSGEPLSQNIEDQLVGAVPSAAAIASAVANFSIAGLAPSTLGGATLLARKFITNRYLIDETAFTWTLFDDDAVTPLLVFDLKDQLGNPSVNEPFERVPA